MRGLFTGVTNFTRLTVFVNTFQVQSGVTNTWQKLAKTSYCELCYIYLTLLDRKEIDVKICKDNDGHNNNNNNNNNNSVHCSFRNIGCLRVLSTSVNQLPRILVRSSFYPASLMTDLLQLFLGLPLFLFPWGFHSRAAFDISPSSFLNVWPIHLNFLFLISRFISSSSVTLS